MQSSGIGLYIEFTARAGMRDALAAHLLSAGESYRREAGTHQFVVHLSPASPDSVFVYERYENEAAKSAHEAAEGYSAIRATTGTFLAGAPKVSPLSVLGGKM